MLFLSRTWIRSNHHRKWNHDEYPACARASCLMQQRNYKKNCEMPRLKNEAWYDELLWKLAHVKVKRKNVIETSGYEKTNVNCDRIYSNITTIKPKDGEEIIPRNNWHIMVDERTGYKVSNFHDTKMVWWCQLVLNLRKDKHVKVVSQDYASKNKQTTS